MIKFFPLGLLGVLQRIPLKNKNALVAEVSNFEKYVKYANEMTNDGIHSTQFCINKI